MAEEDTDRARSLLNEFCEMIDNTGGLVRDLEGKNKRNWVPAGDPEWLDMAELYLEACKTLGREPMLDHSSDFLLDDEEDEEEDTST